MHAETWSWLRRSRTGIVGVLLGLGVGARVVKAAPSPSPMPPPEAAREPATPPESSSESPPESSSPGAQNDASNDERDPLTGSFELKPRLLLVMNMIYSQRLMAPGAYATFAAPPALTGRQFVISPDDTTLGFSVSGVTFGRFALRGALDVNLKSASPLSSPNVLAPQFYAASIGAYAEHLVVRIGQLTDVVTPFAVMSTNGFPGTYLPGQIGFYRPQLRVDARPVSTPRFQVRVNTSLGRPIQTLQVSDEVVGSQAGLPDGQARLELGAGDASPEANEQVFWRRPYALGLSGHLGRRRVLDLSGAEIANLEVTTWSLGVDLRVEPSARTRLMFRLWRGAVLGDFAGGIFQTVSTERLTPIHATGFQVSAARELRRGWRVAGGFGRDDPDDADVGPGERVVNQAAYGALFWDWSRRVGFACELSRWHTGYKGQGTTRAWRGELMVIIHI